MVADTVGDDLARGGVGVRHDERGTRRHRERADEVPGARGLAQTVGDCAEGEVAGGVSEAVIDLLEAIDIEHERGGDVGVGLTAATEDTLSLALDGAPEG